MIKDSINKLINDLPDEMLNKDSPLVLDLVFDSGFFNGSYLLGVVLFLKEMEKRGYIKVERISGCSIGSLVALLYVTDNLDSINEIYDDMRDTFKETYKLDHIEQILEKVKTIVPENAHEMLNDRVHINYYNIKKMQNIVRNKYKNNAKIFEFIRRSIAAPYIMDGGLLYKNKYIDGMNPYIFPAENNSGKKVLYVDLHSINKLTDFIVIKNEKTNFHRVLTGALEAQLLFMKGRKTDMCSFVGEWSIMYRFTIFIKVLIEKILAYGVYIIMICTKYMGDDYCNNNSCVQFINQRIYNYYTSVLETYCF